jgi:hypothetical protein
MGVLDCQTPESWVSSIALDRDKLKRRAQTK